MLGNRITLNLGWAKLDAQAEVPLREGQLLRLLVKEASLEKLVLQVLGEDKPSQEVSRGVRPSSKEAPPDPSGPARSDPPLAGHREGAVVVNLPVVVQGKVAWVRMEIGPKPPGRELPGLPEDGLPRGSGEEVPVAIDLEWETDVSGPVRAYLQVQGRRLTGGIYFKDGGAAQAAEEMLLGLEEALRRQSFAVEGLRCALKSDLSSGPATSPEGTRSGVRRIDIRL